jgi:signal transduction histidine kinase
VARKIPRQKKRPVIAAKFVLIQHMGMGMGLSLSRSIIEAHGGRIWAEFNEGPGVTVQFGLPAESAGRQSSAASKPL